MALLEGLGGILGGLFGGSDKPAQAGMDQLQQFLSQIKGIQQPYMDAGKQGLSSYQDWLKSQSNPTEFLNKTMGSYQSSPYSQALQQQAMLAAQNAGSASGLTGSTPMMQQMQQNAGTIASQDMNQWLGNVLGLNTQYGQGTANLANMGQNATNTMTNALTGFGNNMSELAFGQQAGKNQDWNNILGGIMSLFG